MKLIIKTKDIDKLNFISDKNMLDFKKIGDETHIQNKGKVYFSIIK